MSFPPRRESASLTRRETLGLMLGGAAALTLTGCGATTESDFAAQAKDGDNKGYIAGDGTVQQIAAAARETRIALAGTTLEGQPWSSDDVLGQVLVINVWGSWCGPCIAELPDLEEAYEATVGKDEPVTFIGVNRRDSVATALAFQKSKKVPYPSLEDDGGKTQLHLQGLASATPTTLVLDRDGMVAGRVSGQVDASVLRAMVMDVVNEV